MKIPENLHYTTHHLWVKADADGQWLAGITDYAQDLLGDIVYVESPKIGDRLQQGQPCGLVESVKTGSDLHAPADGIVVAINEVLASNPEQINDDPYASWIFKFSAADDAVAALMDATAYKTHTAS